MYPQKRGSKCVEIGMKKPRQKADTPALLSWLMLNCETVLSHKRACSPSCGTRRNRTPASRLYGFCGSDNGPDNPCCYLASLLPASVPFLSGGFATHSPRERVWERIGKEWVIDKSLLDFIFSYLYLYFIALDFPTSVFPLSDYPTTEMPTTAKKGKARLFMPCPLSSISCRGGCYRPDLKSSKQVVHLRGYLLKVQIYQPFSRTGYILPWQTKSILVIS